MSLAHLRDGPLAERKLARAASLNKRAARLRALNAITTSITQHCGLQPALNTDFDAVPTPPLTPAEESLLDAADVTKGRYFQDSILPLSIEAIEGNPAIQSSLDKSVPSSVRVEGANDQAQTHVSVDTDARIPTDASEAIKSPRELPVDDASPTVHDEAASKNPPQSDAHETPRHRPRTVHLPPKEVQEERFREKQLRQEARRRDAAESERLAAEPASSPHSTVAASTATPMPVDPSPVTSVDETAQPTVSHTHDKEQNAENPSVQSQRDSLLESQKEIARREALGSEVDSPDVQLRLEQEQAAKANRDAAATAHSTSAIKPTGSTDEASPVSALVAGTLQTKPDAPDVIPRQRTSRPSLVNNMPPRDPALAKAAVPMSDGKDGAELKVVPSTIPPGVNDSRHKAMSAMSSESPKSTQKQPLGLRDALKAIGEDAKVKNTQRQVLKRQQRPEQDKPQSLTSMRHSALLKNEGYVKLKGAAEDSSRDYLEPLFRIQIHDPPNGRPLHELLQKASKVVTTEDQVAGLHEKQNQRILRRIYQLQNANRWSLRQMEPCPEPVAVKTHMDHLLDEMKWMRTDFRQERKMKKATAKYLAEQCAEWVNAEPDIRHTMQVKLRATEAAGQETVVPHSPADTNAENGDRHSQGDKSPPGLDDSINDQDSVDDFDMPRTPQYATIIPSELFSAINMDKDSSHLQESEAFQHALADLPLLTPFEDIQPPAPLIERRPVPAVSRFCKGKVMTQIAGAPKKRSRFDYEDEDELLSDSGPASKRPRASQEDSGLRPEQTDVALFDPENKLLRTRLHANTAFRPPSEFQMPSSQFYEYRTASQWTEEDQQTLRRLAKEYSFNWSLIADQLCLPSQFTSAADRRTPWECFERWVELESLPNEMRKTLYFKTWNQRLEAASRNNEARYLAQLAQQSQTPGQQQTIMRRKTTPFKVDKRRQNRYLHTVDAMRKLARKREQQAHKQAEAQKAAHMRKQHENAAPKNGIPSPQEFSRMRQERDVQIAARQERYREQVLAQQRASQIQQRAGQYPNQQQHHPNAAANRPAANMPHGQNPQLQPGAPQQINHQGAPNTQHANVAGAQRNGHLAVPQMGMQGNIPQAQMQPNMRGSNTNQPHATPEMQQRILEAQRAAQLKNTQMNNQQYSMAPPNRASPGGMHMPNGVMGNQQNPSMVNNRAQQGKPNYPGTNGNASASPHMPPPPTPSAQGQQPHQLSSGHVPAISQITHQMQSQHPHATPDKIQELTKEHMKQLWSQQSVQARQSALSAAAGTHAVTPAQNGTSAYNQNQAAFQQNNVPNGHTNYNIGNQQYSQIMRQRLLNQQSQLAANGSANGVPANSSPRVSQASPVQQSPNMGVAQPVANSRTPTPQMARMGSSSGVNQNGSGTPQPQPTPQHTPQHTPQQAQNIQSQSPGIQQGSPRPVVAGVARQ